MMDRLTLQDFQVVCCCSAALFLAYVSLGHFTNFKTVWSRSLFSFLCLAVSTICTTLFDTVMGWLQVFAVFWLGWVVWYCLAMALVTWWHWLKTGVYKHPKKVLKKASAE